MRRKTSLALGKFGVKPFAGLIFLTVLLSIRAASSQNPLADRLAARIAPEVQKTLISARIPSAAVALVNGDGIIWTAGFGASNVWAKTPANPDTVYLIGSIFKTISTYALLQQMEQGKFRLDDRVNDYLTDFKIRGERSTRPVTFRHLLTHTSGLPTDFGPHPIWGDSTPLALSEYLAKSLRLQRPPLTRVLYSNIAYTLVAYLVEKFSGVPFKDYIQEQIFKPLDLRNTSFDPRPDMVERLAIPYMYNRWSRKFVAVELKKADVWPAGMVYGTVKDLAGWLIFNLNRGESRGFRLISEETFLLMMTRQHEQFNSQLVGGWLNETSGYGLTWCISRKNGETLFAHSGSINGYTGFIVGNLDRKTGFVVLTNGNQVHRYLYKLALTALDMLDAASR
jgi:CubicO group peptidase (beta-lactamase class C family)